MTLLEADGKIRKLNLPALTTGEVAAALGISPSHASTLLRRLAAAGRVHHLMRNRWLINDRIDPLVLPEYLTAPWPTYVSLQTALFRHQIISQAPSVVYAVSLGRTARHTTPLGDVSIHHLDPSFFFGFEVTGRPAIKIALPEKALVDLLYLSPARSQLFASWPELEIPASFNRKTARQMADKIRFAPRRLLVRKRLDEILRQS